MAQFIKEPMKAPSEIEPFISPFIHYPMFSSQKYDGFRMVMLPNGMMVSPRGKPFANTTYDKYFMEAILYCQRNHIVLDGEVWSPNMTFSDLSSLNRSHNKQPPEHLGFYVFDALTLPEWEENAVVPCFEKRYYRYLNQLNALHLAHVFPVQQTKVFNAMLAEDRYNQHIDADHEGIMLKSPSAGYKHGRCTAQEGAMFKYKQFLTMDARVIGFVLQRKMNEDIERTHNELGHLERVHTKASFSDDQMIGAFIVLWEDKEFKVKTGKGCDNDWKHTLYCNQDQIIGKHLEFKYMPHGTKDKPRIGSFVRWREDLD